MYIDHGCIDCLTPCLAAGSAERLACVALEESLGCLVTVDCTAAGQYLLAIQQAGQPVGCQPKDETCGAPRPLSISAGASDINSSYVAAPDALVLTAGDAAAFAVYARDEHVNAVDAAAVTLMLQPSSGGALFAQVMQVWEAYSQHNIMD